MTIVALLLLACGGASELNQPNPPPQWPLHNVQAGQAKTPATTPTPAEVAEPTEEAGADEAEEPAAAPTPEPAADDAEAPPSEP